VAPTITPPPYCVTRTYRSRSPTPLRNNLHHIAAGCKRQARFSYNHRTYHTYHHRLHQYPAIGWRGTTAIAAVTDRHRRTALVAGTATSRLKRELYLSPSGRWIIRIGRQRRPRGLILSLRSTLSAQSGRWTQWPEHSGGRATAQHWGCSSTAALGYPM
jgi:hypothetical protein